MGTGAFSIGVVFCAWLSPETGPRVEWRRLGFGNQRQRGRDRNWG
jgi:hypothetical protein